MDQELAIHCRTKELYDKINEKYNISISDQGWRRYGDQVVIYPYDGQYSSYKYAASFYMTIKIITAEEDLGSLNEPDSEPSPIEITDRTCVVCRNEEEWLEVAKSINDLFIHSIPYEKNRVIALKEKLTGPYDYHTSERGLSEWDYPIEASVYLASLKPKKDQTIHSLLGLTNQVILFKRGDLVTLKEKPYEDIAIVTEDMFKGDKSFLGTKLRTSSNIIGSAVGKNTQFGAEFYELITDLEISFKLKQNEN